MTSVLLRRGTVFGAALALSASLGLAVSGDNSAAAPTRTAVPLAASCTLGNGVKHVISLVFDNVHFSRDNPNVPSDLEQMPHLLNFLKSNGTVFSNTHTPLIAHTANDSLTIYTGLYGDRHGQPLTNSYKTYNPDGTTDPAGVLRVLDEPGARHAKTPRRRARHHADDGLLRHGAGDRCAEPADARSVGAVHARRMLGRRFLHGEHGA